MKESSHKNYDELLLFLNVTPAAKLLGVSRPAATTECMSKISRS